MFRFASPEWLYMLLLLPLLVGVFIVLVRRKQRAMARFARPETLSQLLIDVSSLRVRNKFILFGLAYLFLILALARPQMGSKLREDTRSGVEIMLAVDISNSMLAQDFEPNRLQRTKFAIERLIEKMTSDRLGLIVFAGDAYVQLPITSDYTAARSFAANISPDMVSKQGTAIGAAIDLAVNSFSSGSEGSRILIIISDGENHEDDPIAAAELAAEKGVRIYTIGIGTPEGAPIPVGNDFLKDEKGAMVVSKLDEKTLQEVAVITGGAYIRASSQSVGLDEIAKEIAEMEQKTITATVFDEYNEQYHYLVALALLVLCVEFVMLERKNHILERFNIFKRSK